jgi:hypothetical protein
MAIYIRCAKKSQKGGPKEMAVRGVYSDLEKKMLEGFEKDAATREGWTKPMALGTILSLGGSPHVTE